MIFDKMIMQLSSFSKDTSYFSSSRGTRNVHARNWQHIGLDLDTARSSCASISGHLHHTCLAETIRLMNVVLKILRAVLAPLHFAKRLESLTHADVSLSLRKQYSILIRIKGVLIH